MKNINITKTANIVAMGLMAAMAIAPLFAGAQFTVPDAASAGANVPNQASASAIIITIINILLSIAGLLAVIFLIVGGFRYITAGGNEETAEAAKKTITNAIIGIVIVILAFVIVRVISNALTKGTAG